MPRSGSGQKPFCICIYEMTKSDARQKCRNGMKPFQSEDSMQDRTLVINVSLVRPRKGICGECMGTPTGR